VIYEVVEGWRYHVVSWSNKWNIYYLDIYQDKDDWLVFTRVTSAIGWQDEVERGIIKGVLYERLPMALAACLPRICAEHGIHLGEPVKEQRESRIS